MIVDNYTKAQDALIDVLFSQTTHDMRRIVEPPLRNGNDLYLWEVVYNEIGENRMYPAPTIKVHPEVLR